MIIFSSIVFILGENDGLSTKYESILQYREKRNHTFRHLQWTAICQYGENAALEPFLGFAISSKKTKRLPKENCIPSIEYNADNSAIHIWCRNLHKQTKMNEKFKSDFEMSFICTEMEETKAKKQMLSLDSIEKILEIRSLSSYSRNGDMIQDDIKYAIVVTQLRECHSISKCIIMKCTLSTGCSQTTYKWMNDENYFPPKHSSIWYVSILKTRLSVILSFFLLFKRWLANDDPLHPLSILFTKTPIAATVANNLEIENYSHISFSCELECNTPHDGKWNHKISDTELKQWNLLFLQFYFYVRNSNT